MSPHGIALILTVSANAFAVLGLLARKAHKTFPLLVAYLVVLLVQNTLGTLLPPYTKMYEWLYNVTEPIIILASIFVVRELYRAAFAGYPGISSLARWSTYAAALLAILLCAVMILATRANIVHDFVTGYVVLWERCVAFSLAVFISLMIFLLSRYPIDVPFSLAANIVIFTIFFCGTFALSFASGSRNIKLEWFAFYAIVTLTTACYLAWGISVRPILAERTMRVRGKLGQEDEQHLLTQLSALNRVLGKSSRGSVRGKINREG